MDTNSLNYCMKGGKKISEGGFGCVYYPEISCSGKIIKKSDFISKIQKEDINSQIEKFMGNLIQKIPNYNMFYAPVISECPIDLTKLREGDIQECNIFQKKGIHKKFILQKIPYIKGKSFLENFFNTKNYHNKKQETLLSLYDSFPYLLIGIQKLYQFGIIHYDIKKENIMFDLERNIPIIIDFGLSFHIPSHIYKNKEAIHIDNNLTNTKVDSDINDNIDTNMDMDINSNMKMNVINYEKNILHQKQMNIDIDMNNIDFNNLNKYFYIYAPDYYLWCPEIHFINYLLHVNKNPSKTEINNIVNEIIDKSYLKKIVSKDFLIIYKDFLSSYLFQFEGQNWKSIIVELFKHYKKWDSFSLCYMYIRIIYNILKQSTIDFIDYLKNNNETILMDFVILLMDGLHPNPNIRSSVYELIVEFENLFLKYYNKQGKEYEYIYNLLHLHKDQIHNSLVEEERILSQMEIQNSKSRI